MHGKDGLDMLMDAVRQRDGYMTWTLCQAGVSVEPTASVDAHGNTPLLTACARGNVVVVDSLLSAGADATAVNKLGVTALMAACRR